MLTALNQLALMSSAGHISWQQELCDKLEFTTHCKGMHKLEADPQIMHGTSIQLLPSVGRAAHGRDSPGRPAEQHCMFIRSPSCSPLPIACSSCYRHSKCQHP